MDYTWIGFGLGGVLWMVIALLWERRYKDKDWEFKKAKEKIRQLEDKNTSLRAEILAIQYVIKGQ